MNDVVVWIIIAGFYAPLHYLFPLMVLFITGQESEAVRRRLIRRAVIDSTVSMAVAFFVAILLVGQDRLSVAMLCLLVSMPYPFIGIWRHRRDIVTSQSART